VKSLFFSYDMEVDKAYIIRVKGHELSERKAEECLKSCQSVGMQAQFWDAYDGTGGGIIAPEHLKDHPTMKMIKVTDHYLVRAEIACALSHIGLWAKCVEQDKPLVVLEHDAVMIAPYNTHQLYNSICYLGCIEQAKGGWSVVATPVHGSDGPNYHFLLRTHAYAIDPAVAKNMLAYVLQHGICGQLDRLLRADLFPIHQMGLVAFDNHENLTSIKGKTEEYRSSRRNDNLEF
jgi:hypothetical protein